MNSIKKIDKKNDEIMLISIMSYYARQIFDGTKLFEFRKSPLKINDLNKQIFVYSAKDDKAVIGSFKVKQIYHGNVHEIMRITGYDKRKDGIEILKYFGDNPNCYALELYDVKSFSKPLTLKEMRKVSPDIKLPQYYTYFKPSSPIYNMLVGLNKQLSRKCDEKTM